MPNLLQMSDSSVVVVDPKGELAAVTAPFRRTLGRVVIINPFGVLTRHPGYEDLKSAGYNPLAAIDPTLPSFNVQASLLADAMITVGGKDPHWDESARALIAALVMFVVMEARGLCEHFLVDKEPRPTVPTIARIRELLCQASEPGGRNHGPLGLPALALKMMETQLPGLRNKASQFTNWNDEIQSITSSAKRHTEAFDDPEIAADLAVDGFDFRNLKRRPVTVYLILPPEMMARHSKWLRLVLTAAIQGVLRARAPREPKTLFMLDEFFALGHLEIISTVWALVRGYGVQIMPILQDLNQLKKLYPDMWETFTGMAGAVACFGPNDMTTAEWMSKRAGDTTKVSMNYNKSDGKNDAGNGSKTESESESYSPVKAPLVAAHQLFGMKPGYMQVTLDGLSNVVPTYAPAYYEIRQCEERARKNPYYLG
jgi:type IV secretion system protein VirD4